MTKKFIFQAILLLSIGLGVQASAQTLPPDQPEQDACSALQICGNFFTPYSYEGEGMVSDLTQTPCGVPGVPGGETNSSWFLLEVNTSGIIVFSIVPVDSLDDYDFAVLDITNGNCDSLLQSEVVRCNFNANQNHTYPGGIVGLNTTSTITQVAGGSPATPFLQEISANAGDRYLIMVNNWGHDDCYGNCPGSGFLLDFTGTTASFNQPPAPRFSSVLPQCDYSQSITVQLSDNVLCSSIAADGSDFHLTPAGTISGAEGIACSGAAGYTQKVRLTFSNSLSNGNYTIHAQTGTDNNTLLGLCEAELSLPDSLIFHVGNDPLQMLSIDSPACQTLNVHINSPVKCTSIAADGSDFKVSGPSTVTVDGASGINCASGYTQTVAVHLAQPIAVDGVYKLLAEIGTDNNTVMDSCGRTVLPGAYHNFTVNSFNGLLQAGPDTSTCMNVLNLYGINHGVAGPGGFQYTWTPSAGIAYPNNPNTSVSLSPGYHAYILSTIDAQGCYLRDSAITKMIPFVASVDPVEGDFCEGKSIALDAAGGESYQWADNPQMTGTPDDLSCADCPDPFAIVPAGNHTFWVKVTNDLGCTDTLSSLLHVLANPVVSVVPKDTTINYGDGIILHAVGAQTYYWTPESSLLDPMVAEPYAMPKENTDYVVIGADKYGCTGSDTAHVRINFRLPVFIPNAFSPNDDGINDVFKIEHLTFQKVLIFQVYDRWGHLVFHTNSSTEGWDGRYHGQPMPQDTYNYIIKLGYPDDYREVFKGTITLLR